VEVTVEEDTVPRQAEIPEDLMQALEENPEAKEAFGKLAYTHQKEYVNAILEAKREKTRKARISRTIAALNSRK
jgi:uncharacterized protein YdeI (YjbR/CyaY-like superfamily)